MSTYEEEAAAEKAAADQKEQDDQWKELVKSVLSSTRIDPASKGKQFQYFVQYTDQVTPEQVDALQRSAYGRSYTQFIELWKKLPETKSKGELYEVTDLFKNLATSTNCPYREIARREKTDKKPVGQLEILKRVNFLSNYWIDKGPSFDPDDLAEHLNTYIAIGIEWPFVEAILLGLCIHRAAEEQRIKGRSDIEKYMEGNLAKTPYVGPFVGIFFYLLGVLLPVALQFGTDAAIIYWAWDRLSGEKFSIWAWIGVAYVAITIPISIIYYGTSEIRYSLKKILQPGWDRFESSINADLNALNKTVNGYRTRHMNLRLMRDQLTRLQNTKINIPVQFLTLIDRSIAKGLHHW